MFIDCVSLYHSVDRYRISAGPSPHFPPTSGDDPLQASHHLTTFGLAALLAGVFVQADYNLALSIIKSQTSLNRAMFSLYYVFNKPLPQKSIFYQTLPSFIQVLKECYAMVQERKIVPSGNMLVSYCLSLLTPS